MADILQQLARQQGRLDHRLRSLRFPPGTGHWREAGETWTYASATTFTIADPAAGVSGPSDFTNIYQAGDFIRFKQGGAYLYFIISAVSYSDPTTTITIDKQITGGQVALANAAITDNYYSKAWSPQGCGPTRFTPGYYTSTSWDGDAKNGADAIIDLSAAFGVPAGVKAVAVAMAVTDETVGIFGRLTKDNGTTTRGTLVSTQVASKANYNNGIVECDSNGDIYFSQSGELDHVYIRILGYWS